MVTWGVLRLPVASGPASGPASGSTGVVSAGVGGDGALGAGLAAHLDGAMAIAADASLAGALAVLPPPVTRIVELDATSTEDVDTIAMLARVLAAADADADADGRHGAVAAVVAARPMADALKRVEGDTVVSGIDRDGLMIPCLPFVLDRAALAAVYAAARAEGVDRPDEPVALLLAAGHAVLVVPVDGEPRLVRAASDEVTR